MTHTHTHNRHTPVPYTSGHKCIPTCIREFRRISPRSEVYGSAYPYIPSNTRAAISSVSVLNHIDDEHDTHAPLLRTHIHMYCR